MIISYNFHVFFCMFTILYQLSEVLQDYIVKNSHQPSTFSVGRSSHRPSRRALAALKNQRESEPSSQKHGENTGEKGKYGKIGNIENVDSKKDAENQEHIRKQQDSIGKHEKISGKHRKKQHDFHRNIFLFLCESRPNHI